MVSTAQLQAAGLRPGAIGGEVPDGRLHRVHRGVYAVGHARADLARAAVGRGARVRRAGAGGAEPPDRRGALTT